MNKERIVSIYPDEWIGAKTKLVEIIILECCENLLDWVTPPYALIIRDRNIFIGELIHTALNAEFSPKILKKNDLRMGLLFDNYNGSTFNSPFMARSSKLFNYCPSCGKKINWSKLQRGESDE